MNEALLHEEGTAKFVLLIKTSQFEEFESHLNNHTIDKFNDYLIVSDKNALDHEDIVYSTKKEKGISYLCFGGGFLNISENEIFAYGKSIKYKIADENIVKIILSEKFNNKKIRVSMGFDPFG